MIEKQNINGKDVWLKVDQFRVQPDVIPAEYFIAAYHYNEPDENATDGELIKNEDGSPKQFESPVAAVAYAWKKLREQ